MASITKRTEEGLLSEYSCREEHCPWEEEVSMTEQPVLHRVMGWCLYI